jgi:hypothetical protein
MRTTGNLPLGFPVPKGAGVAGSLRDSPEPLPRTLAATGDNGSVRGADDAISCWSFERVAVRTTRTFETIFSLRINSSRTVFISRSIPLDGFATKSMAPSSSALSVMSAPSRDSELTTRIGLGFEDMINSVACSPSTWGMLMSMVMTSGRRDSFIDTASFPSRASPTTSIEGSEVMIETNTFRMNAESSTISTRILPPGFIELYCSVTVAAG